MRKKSLKLIAIILLVVMLASNFSYLGVGIISYAANSIETNNQNIEFDAQIKDNNMLSLMINVKKDGYLNGKVIIENNNFTIKDIESPYINNIEGNVINLKQINAGTIANIDLPIEPIKKEIYDISLLNSFTKISLDGIYKNKTQKDINIKATREVKLAIQENNSNENVEGRIDILANKLLKINNEDKRIVQLSLELGLKENNYPIKEIDVDLTLPNSQKYPEVVGKANFNNMTSFNMKHVNEKINLKMDNLPKGENNNLILWKKTGNDNIVVSLIYDKDEKLDNLKIKMKETITLQNGKQLVIDTESQPLVELTEDALVQIDVQNKESNIYKGKLYANEARQFETKTIAKVNLPKAEENIQINEEASMYLINGKEQNANVNYVQTIISKEQFDKILGTEGKITVKNGKEVIATIDATTAADKDNNLIINYLPEKNIETITIETTTPIETGNLEFKHIKEIKNQSVNIVKEATEINTKINLKYNSSVTENTSKIKLEESKSDVVFTTNANNLSTVVENNVEMKVLLKTNNEMNNLFENPVIEFELPQEVENVQIKNTNLVYENELKIKSSEVQGNKIVVTLEGKQTKHKEEGIEGAIITVDAKLKLNKYTATKDSNIIMNIKNGTENIENINQIRIIAPKDITLVHSVKAFEIEEIGENQTKTVKLNTGENSSKIYDTAIDVSNNNESAMKNVKVAGIFPTDNKTNNLGVKITKGFDVSTINGAKVYYTENEEATEDIQNPQNQWEENIKNPNKVKKFLIIIPEMETQAKYRFDYEVEIPSLLEYNQKAYQKVAVRYTNSLAGEEKMYQGTTIILDTGVGAIANINMKAKVGANEIENLAEVKNGEVVKLQIMVSNIGSEEVKNLKVLGNVPKETVLVKPKDNYVYLHNVYYEELPDTKFEEIIPVVKVGETVTVEYEIRVKNDAKVGTEKTVLSTLNYGDVVKKSNEIKFKIAEGLVRLTVKRGTDLRQEIINNLRYCVIVENLSDIRQENVLVKLNLDNSVKIREVRYIYTEDLSESKNRKLSEEEYVNGIKVSSIEPNEKFTIRIDVDLDRQGSEYINFSSLATYSNVTIKSNEITDRVSKVKATINMFSNSDKYVKSGDRIEYTIKVKNESDFDVKGYQIIDNISKNLFVEKVMIDNKIIEKDFENNYIELLLDIEMGQEKTINIECVVNKNSAMKEPVKIINTAEVFYKGINLGKTQEIINIIEVESNNVNPNNPDFNPDKNPDDDIILGNNMITGIAWLDANSNGIKDNDEKVLSNVEVYLYNPNTKRIMKNAEGNIIKAVTDEHGVYIINSIGKGEYILIFNYDKTKYGLTKYNVEGNTEQKNSDVLLNNLIINNDRKEVAATDIIKIVDKNIADVNIGLIELKKYDLKLDKFVTRVLVQDNSGTIVKEFNDSTLAKVELKAKKISGSNVIVEYTIRVSNVGEVDAYVRKIVDYKPNNLKFNSELNKDWYQEGDNLYNTSFSNEKIKPGETRDVKLTLTKALTNETPLGRINNTAKIEECYSEYNLKENDENNKGMADIIIAVSTGGAVWTTTIISMIVMVTIAVFIVVKRYTNKKRKL